MTVEQLSTRLEKVERVNRRMRVAGTLALVLAMAIATLGQAAPPAKVVQAERFELLDGEGKLLARLGLSDHATPELELLDDNGRRRITLAVEDDGMPHLRFSDEAGKSRARLYVRSDGSPILTFNDKDRIRASLSASDFGPSLALFDGSGQSRAELSVFPDGAPRLEFSDKSGKSIFKAPPK